MILLLFNDDNNNNYYITFFNHPFIKYLFREMMSWQSNINDNNKKKKNVIVLKSFIWQSIITIHFIYIIWQTDLGLKSLLECNNNNNIILLYDK